MKDVHIHDKIELGFVFEYFFNLGMYATLRPYMHKSKSMESVIDKYLEYSDLDRKKIQDIILKKFKVTDLEQEKTVRDVVNKLAFCGRVCGEGLMKEFLKSKNLIRNLKFGDQNVENDYIQKSAFTVDFMHFNIINPFGISDVALDNKRYEFINEVFQTAFNNGLTPAEYSEYSLKGNFLNADSLIMLGTRKQKYILSVDNKIKLSTALRCGDCKDLLQSLSSLLAEKSKRIKFNNLDADSSFIEGFKLAPKLIDYASTMSESTLLKVVQAGSYSYSLLSMLNSKGLINKEVNVSLSGYFDSDYSFINYPKCKPDDKKLIDSLYEFKKAYLEWERTEIEPDLFQKQRGIKQKSIYTTLKKSMIKDTNIPREQFKELEKFNNGFANVTLSEIIDGFTHTSMELRAKHAEVVYKDIMNREINVIILNGCPGIGKTTTLVKALKTMNSFVFMYFSPRTALGDDLEYKFIENGSFFADDLILLSTSSKDEESECGRPVVNFLNNSGMGPDSQDILFLPKERYRDHMSKKDEASFKMKTASKVAVIDKVKPGTLSRLCKAQKICSEDSSINKIVSTISIQSTKKKGNKLTTDHLKTAFPFIVSNNVLTGGYSIDTQVFLNFAKRNPNIVLMIDEVTGSDEGVALYRQLKSMLIDPLGRLPKDVRDKMNIKLIVADASLTNSTIIQHHLEGSKNSKVVEANGQKIYVSKVEEEDKQTLYRKVIDTKFGSASIINANSYPAARLKMNYHISLNKQIIDSDKLDKTVFDKNQRQDDLIIEECMKYLIDKKELQAIIYVQDVRRLDSLVEKLKNIYISKTGCVLEENKDYLIITSRLKPNERKSVIEYNNSQAEVSIDEKRLRVVFMTSSASRGISFKDCKNINCVSQLYSIESSLMEIVQLVYRCRGHEEWDVEKEKELNFYIIQDIYATNEDEFEYKKYKTLSAVLSYISLLRGSILTRVKGYSTIGGQDLSIIPLGATGVQSMSDSIIENIAEAIKEMKKEIIVCKDFSLINLVEELEDIFGSFQVDTINQILYNNKGEETTEGKVYSNFLKTLDKGVLEVTKKRFFKDFYIINGLIVFSISNAEDQVYLLKDKLLKNRNVCDHLYSVASDAKISDKIRKPLSSIYELLEFERNNPTSYSKSLSEENAQNRFIAFPLDAFRIYDQFEGMSIEKNEMDFGQVMYKLMLNYTSVHSVLPIVTQHYSGLPFITFKSGDLEAKRYNLFKENYLMTSTEINLLNLLMLE